ncbi:MAG: HTTM domain-containing protein [Gemmataceae bacterium]
MKDYSEFSLWTRFWHQPIRAERLATTRILLALALLTDQLFQYLPFLSLFFGPDGVAPEGTYDQWVLSRWGWTILIFNTDNMAIVQTFFWSWVGVTVLFLVGWQTRLMNVWVWFLTLCFINRNPSLCNYADDAAAVLIFLLLFMPTGRAFSLDAYLRRRTYSADNLAPPMTSAWPVRVLQIQLSMIYFTTGLAKLVPSAWDGTWWDGTSLHYVLNDTTMGRWSYAQLPLPFWFTALLTYIIVWWEALFIPLVIFKYTRYWALIFGILLHIGIYVTLDVGWFSWYMIAFYGAWIPDSFWKKWSPYRTTSGV